MTAWTEAILDGVKDFVGAVVLVGFLLPCVLVLVALPGLAILWAVGLL